MISEEAHSLSPALNTIDHALRRNPRGFNRVPGELDIYITKTKVIITVDYLVPALRLWFTVRNDMRQVRKQWIELCLVDELPF